MKFYTKEVLKFLNMTLISFGFMIAIILIKYKPIYAVNISGQTLGYIQDKKIFKEMVEDNVENYSAKNIDNVTLLENPKYELKFIERAQETNESEIIITLQSNLDITYKYYEIKSNDTVIEQVDTIEAANQIVEDINKLTEDEALLTINEAKTKNIEELSLSNLEDAKSNIIEKLDIDTTEAIANINGIKIASIPIPGRISSRYGARSSIRSSAHTGLDIEAPKGTPIKVVANGTVTHAAESGAYGYLVKVDHGNGVETWYAHTSKMLVTEGQEVKAGDVIALVGSTGNSTGPHLHLEVRINGQHVNPQKYIYN